MSAAASPQAGATLPGKSGRALLLAAGTLLAALTAGCTIPGGGSGHSLAYYLLELPVDAAEAAQTTGRGCGVLEVGAPAPAPGFGSARMIYRREQHRLEHFAYSEWAATPSRMVEALLLQAMERTGEFAAVVSSPPPVEPHLRLDSSDLKLMQVFDDSGSHALLELRVQMVDSRRRELLGGRLLSASAPAAENPAGGVAAANVALGMLVDELVQFVTDVSRVADCGDGLAHLP